MTLRTFLNHIIGYCDLVQQDAADNNLSALVAGLPEIASEAGVIVDRLNDLDPGSPGFQECCGLVRIEIAEFGAPDRFGLWRRPRRHPPEWR